MPTGPDIITQNRGMQRGDLGAAPTYIIGGVIFVVGLLLLFGTSSADIGLMVTGVGLVLIGVQDKPRLSLRWVRYTGPPGLVLSLWGLLLFVHVL